MDIGIYRIVCSPTDDTYDTHSSIDLQSITSSSLTCTVLATRALDFIDSNNTALIKSASSLPMNQY